MGGTACKAKIILNGSTIQSELAELCYQIEEAADIDYANGIAMVRLLNDAENAVFATKRIWLELAGFTGPWPASLDSPEVLKLAAAARRIDKGPPGG